MVWPLHKFSNLLTPYDRLFDPKTFETHKKFSKTITHTKYDTISILNEEYMHFYTHSSTKLSIILDYFSLNIFLSTNETDISLIKLNFLENSNIRMNTKNNAISFRFHKEWEKKFQINFYSESDLADFKNAFQNICKNNFKYKEKFINDMNEISGELQIEVKQTNKSVQELKNEFFNLIANEQKLY